MFGPFLRHFVPWYGHFLIRRHFDGFYIDGLDAFVQRAKTEPLILACNHIGWWDGILLLTLQHHHGLEGKFLTDADALRRIPWLTQLGAIGIERDGVLGPMNGMEEAVDWLSAPGRIVWMFPQGRYRPAHLRPLGIQRGVALLARASRARVVPVTWDAAWFLAHLPAAAMVIGPPLPPSRVLDVELEATMSAQLDRIDTWFDGAQKVEPFVPFINTRLLPIEATLPSRVWAWLKGWVDWALRRG